MGSNPAIPTIDLERRAVTHGSPFSLPSEVSVLERFLHWMGLGLCHQLPERSFFGGGVQLPVCSRDTGIYLGFLLAFLLVAAVHRKERPAGFPRRSVWIAMGVFLAALAWDGVTSYAGLRTTTNGIRLLTGLGVGYSSAVLVFAMLQDELWRVASSERVLEPGWRFAVWLAGIPVSFVAIRWGGPLLGIGYPVLTAFSIVFTLAAIDLVIVALFPPFDRKARRLADLWLPVTIAVALAFIQIAASGAVRLALER